MNEDNELDASTTQRVRAQLEQGAQRLNVYTVQRLARARAAALNGEAAPARPRAWLIPAAGAAMAAVLVISLTVQVMHKPDSSVTDLAALDLELLNSSDDLDLYQDLDFYTWLDDEHESS